VRKFFCSEEFLGFSDEADSFCEVFDIEFYDCNLEVKLSDSIIGLVVNFLCNFDSSTVVLDSVGVIFSSFVDCPEL
jgi:hypothetical protein